MGRSIVAVAAGLVTCFAAIMLATAGTARWLLTHGGSVEPSTLLATWPIITLAAAILGGYLTARLAARRPWRHVAVLAGVLALATGNGGDMAGARPGSGEEARRANGTAKLLAPIGVLLGGVVGTRRRSDASASHVTT